MSEYPEHETAGNKCPSCGHKLDLATGLGNAKPPEPDDISFCVKCGEPGMFNADGVTTRKLTSDQMAQLMAEPALAKIYAIIKEAVVKDPI